MMKQRSWEQTVPLRPFSTARSWVLVASAGCGKTHTIEQAISVLLLDGVKPTEIMYLLFNHDPAVEFRARFEAKGLTAEDMQWWGTHHSIARKLLHLSTEKILRGKKLRDWGATRGFDFNPKDDGEDTILDEHAPTTWDEVLSSLEVKLYDGSMEYDLQEERLLDAFSKSEVEEGFYTDTRYLLKALHMQLIPAGVKYVFIDEGQDNGTAQFEYFRHLLTRPEILGFMMAGDDKQAINGFKGGRSALFLDFEAERYVCLPTTWRCPPKVLADMNDVIKPVRDRSPITLSSARSIEGVVEDIDDFDDCIYELTKWSKAKKSIMVLSRNRYFLSIAYSRLKTAGVPMSLRWLEKMREGILALKELHDTGLLTPSLLGKILPSERGQRGELLKKPHWKRGFIGKIRSEQFGDDLEAQIAYDKLLHGGLELSELPILGFTDQFLAQIQAFSFPEEVWNAEPDDVRYFKRVLQTAGLEWTRVKLSTIHTAKGGEADVVVLLKNITGKVEEAEFGDPDEERRVWYVAKSRAKERLVHTQIRGQRFDLTTELF